MIGSGYRALPTLTAAAAGGVGYYLSSNPPLALTLASVYGLAAWLTLRYYGALPDGVRSGDDWRVARWNGVFVAVVTAGAFAAMYAEPPLDVGLAQALLLYGVGWTGYVVALAQMSEADALKER